MSSEKNGTTLYLQSVKRPPSDTAALLHTLVQAWDTDGPPGIVEIEALAERLNKRIRDIRRLVHPLVVEGLITMDHHGQAVFLTPEGYASVSSRRQKDRSGGSE